MAIDPRLAQRRRSVAEQRIRTNLRRLIGAILLVGLVAAGVWMLRSPVFSVSVIEVSGVVASDARQTLMEAGVTLLDPDRTYIEWTRSFPTNVEVRRGRVEADLDPERFARFQLLLQVLDLDDFFSTPRDRFQGLFRIRHVTIRCVPLYAAKPAR